MKVSGIIFPPRAERFDALNDLMSSDTYRIYFSGHWLFKYDVTAPNGSLIACAVTKWGAFRAIDKHVTKWGALRASTKRVNRKAVDKWWEQPYIAVDMSKPEE